MSDELQRAFRELCDAVTQHPTTKPFKPQTIREMQLETELRYIRMQVMFAIDRLRNITDMVDGLVNDDADESPF